MIYSYGVTRIGTYHIEHNIVCQDAHYIKKLSDNCIVAAVADGLGSEKYTDVASKVATETAVEMCAEKYSPELDEYATIDLIRQSFRIAQSRIEEIAKENGHEVTQYDTTLDLVIFTRGKMFYGHAGDSGIVALLTCFDDRWVFGVYKKEVASVFLATDGMLETLFPVLLRSQPVKIYVALAQYFMDRDRLGFEELGESSVAEKMSEYIASIPGEQVNDDKTVVVLCDDDIEVNRQPDEYYAVPDWPKLEQERRDAYMREAYPHLFKGKDTVSTGEEKETDEEVSEDMAGKGLKPEGETLDEDEVLKGEESPDKRSPTKMSFGRKLFQKRDKKEAP